MIQPMTWHPKMEVLFLIARLGAGPLRGLGGFRVDVYLPRVARSWRALGVFNLEFIPTIRDVMKSLFSGHFVSRLHKSRKPGRKSICYSQNHVVRVEECRRCALPDFNLNRCQPARTLRCFWVRARRFLHLHHQPIFFPVLLRPGRFHRPECHSTLHFLQPESLHPPTRP